MGVEVWELTYTKPQIPILSFLFFSSSFFFFTFWFLFLCPVDLDMMPGALYSMYFGKSSFAGFKVQIKPPCCMSSQQVSHCIAG